MRTDPISDVKCSVSPSAVSSTPLRSAVTCAEPAGTVLCAGSAGSENPGLARHRAGKRSAANETCFSARRNRGAGQLHESESIGAGILVSASVFIVPDVSNDILVVLLFEVCITQMRKSGSTRLKFVQLARSSRAKLPQRSCTPQPHITARILLRQIRKRSRHNLHAIRSILSARFRAQLICARIVSFIQL